MNLDDAPDTEWLDWIEVQKDATRLWMEGEFEAAIAEISGYLDQEPRLDLKRQAIGFRGSIREEQGDLDAAERDFSTAHELSEQPDYESYTLLLALGSLSERRGEPDTAASWYLKSLETVAEDPTTSGGTALSKLLELRADDGLEDEVRRLCERVAIQSWRLLGLPDQPDLSDLQSAARQLVAAQERPPSAPSGPN